MRGSRLLVAFTAMLAVAALAGCTTTPQQSTAPSTTTAGSHDFYVMSAEAELNESAGIPGDYFQPSTLVAARGDNVTIHFYNAESPEDGADHSFDISAYNVSMVVHPGTWGNVTFTADRAGVFDFTCQFHQPTMRGQLVVLG